MSIIDGRFIIDGSVSSSALEISPDYVLTNLGGTGSFITTNDQNHDITAGDWNEVLGGRINKINTTGSYITVIGGWNNLIEDNTNQDAGGSIILGGGGNTTNLQNHIIGSTVSAIIAGDSNKIGTSTSSGNSNNFIINSLSSIVASGSNLVTIMSSSNVIVGDNVDSAVVIGLRTYTLDQNDTVYLPKVRLGLGVGGTMVTDDANSNVLVRNGTTGEIELNTTISLSDTDNLAEGSTNLYYTDTRVSANSNVVTNTSKVSADGSIITHSDVSDTGASTSGESLIWSGSEWAPGYPNSAKQPGIAYVVVGTITHTPKLDDPLNPYNNIQTAMIAAAVVATATNRYTVEVLPGSYSITTLFQMEDFVDLYFHPATFLNLTNSLNWNNKDTNWYGDVSITASAIAWFPLSGMPTDADIYFECKKITSTNRMMTLSLSAIQNFYLHVKEKIELSTSDRLLLVSISTTPSSIGNIHIKCPVIEHTGSAAATFDITTDNFTTSPRILIESDYISIDNGDIVRIYTDESDTNTFKPDIIFDVRHMIGPGEIIDVTSNASLAFAKVKFVNCVIETTVTTNVEAVSLSSPGAASAKTVAVFDHCTILHGITTGTSIETFTHSGTRKVVCYGNLYTNAPTNGTYTAVGGTVVVDTSLE